MRKRLLRLTALVISIFATTFTCTTAGAVTHHHTVRLIILSNMPIGWSSNCPCTTKYVARFPGGKHIGLAMFDGSSGGNIIPSIAEDLYRFSSLAQAKWAASHAIGIYAKGVGNTDLAPTNFPGVPGDQTIAYSSSSGLNNANGQPATEDLIVVRDGVTMALFECLGASPVLDLHVVKAVSS